jgi:hypothetical protein
VVVYKARGHQREDRNSKRRDLHRGQDSALELLVGVSVGAHLASLS